MTLKNLKLESRPHGIAIVKISRPGVLNALNAETLGELKKALSDLNGDSKVRAVLLTGDGEKAFIAGADISELKDLDSSGAVAISQLGHEVTKLLELMPKPTVAAVNGFALGGGAEMALACDFILASEKAVFGMPEVGLGIIPGFGGCVRLSRYVGMARAKELIFSGRKVNAAEALQMGICNHVFPAEGFLEKSAEWLGQIVGQSASAVGRAKELLNEYQETIGLTFKLDAEALAFGQLMGTPDQREGMTAFMEKRKPKFVGLEA